MVGIALSLKSLRSLLLDIVTGSPKADAQLDKHKSPILNWTYPFASQTLIPIL